MASDEEHELQKSFLKDGGFLINAFCWGKTIRTNPGTLGPECLRP
jgi:hypothetical protein